MSEVKKVWKVPQNNTHRVSIKHVEKFQKKFNDALTIVVKPDSEDIIIYVDNELDERRFESFMQTRVPRIKPEMVDLRKVL